MKKLKKYWYVVAILVVALVWYGNKEGWFAKLKA